MRSIKQANYIRHSKYTNCITRCVGKHLIFETRERERDGDGRGDGVGDKR